MGIIENGREFSLKFLKKHGHLSQSWSSGGIKWTDGWGNEADIRFVVRLDLPNDPHVRLVYKIRPKGTTEWRDIDYKVSLESIPCHFGGQKWFFRCGLYKNGQYCGRRVRSLFTAGDYFGCRHCASLVYYSQTRPGNTSHGWMCRHFDAEEYYEKNVRREFYRGRPTKRYQTYLNKLQRNGQRLPDIHRLRDELLL